MLYLFDIDGTLVDTGGAGMRALREAARGVFGGEGPDLDLAGSTDLGVIANIRAHFGESPNEERSAAFFRVYLERLEWNLAHGAFDGRVLPGVIGLLERLHADERVTIGLLTGNIAGGAAVKMRHFGLDRFFAFGAYGCDFADRNLLGPLALSRAEAHRGRAFSPRHTWVIGDTPKDVACAKAMGARCVGVATGRFSVERLMACGADVAVETLRDWDEKLKAEMAGG